MQTEGMPFTAEAIDKGNEGLRNRAISHNVDARGRTPQVCADCGARTSAALDPPRRRTLSRR